MKRFAFATGIRDVEQRNFVWIASTTRCRHASLWQRGREQTGTRHKLCCMMCDACNLWFALGKVSPNDGRLEVFTRQGPYGVPGQKVWNSRFLLLVLRAVH